MKTKKILVLLIPFLHSCIYEPPTWDKLTMSKIPYNGKEIRTDGYFTSPLSKSNETDIYSNLIFYRNGVVYHFAFTNKIKDYYHDSVRNTTYFNLTRDDRESCRLFQINKDTINIQGWRLNEDYTNFYIINYKLRIVNDTTLQLINENKTIFSFRYLNPKPDSTNVFIP